MPRPLCRPAFCPAVMVSTPSSGAPRPTVLPSATAPRHSAAAWEHFERLGRPRFICAPMVDGSELPFRMQVRRHGAQLAYTPMLHAALFASTEKFRTDNFTTCDGDRPLAVQFCANDPSTLLAAAKLVEGQCDAVDINLGCPQRIARKGHYGAFLMDEWDLIADMVSTLHRGLKVPVWCKIRVFDDVEKTVAYAKMIQDAGCYLLAVHGRTREQKGHNMGLANWSTIAAVKRALSIPVFANGNVRNLDEAEECLSATGCDGVMSADPLLKNPHLFAGEVGGDPFALAREYLEYVFKYPTRPGIVRGHLFKILEQPLDGKGSWCQQLAQAPDVPAMLNFVERLAIHIEQPEASRPANGVPV